MKLDIDGLLRGRDMGYSLRHPDTNRYIETCCCEEPHCHLPGEDSEQRHHYACLMIEALEMYELLGKIRGHIDSTCRECEAKAIVPEIDTLLDKIEGGGE